MCRGATALLLFSLTLSSGCYSFRAVQPAAKALGIDPVERARVVQADGRLIDLHGARVQGEHVVGTPCSSCDATPVYIAIDDVQGVQPWRFDIFDTALNSTVAATTTFTFVGVMLAGMAIE